MQVHPRVSAGSAAKASEDARGLGRQEQEPETNLKSRLEGGLCRLWREEVGEGRDIEEDEEEEAGASRRTRRRRLVEERAGGVVADNEEEEERPQVRIEERRIGVVVGGAWFRG